MSKTNVDKFVSSRLSLQELGKLLNCESCQKLACNPHILGCCDHTFCLSCAHTISGKTCPRCGCISEPDACIPDRVVENLIEAYLPMAKFLGVDVSNLPNNDANKTKSGKIAILKTPSSVSRSSKRISVKATTISESENLATSIVKKRERKASLNESLDCSTSGSVSSVSKINKRNQKGETPLQVACVKLDIQRVKELLTLGANPNTQDNAGWTPLHEAVGCANEEIVALLLENGANPNIPGGQNETPLHEAVVCNRSAIARLLVSHGADVNARNSRGLTPKDLFLNGEEDMKRALESSTVVPITPSNPDRLRQNLQTVQLFILNPEKKSQPRLNKLARTLGFKLVSTFTSQVSHVAVRLDEPSNVIKANPQFYSAVLQGNFIVDFKWIEESEKLERLTDPTQYEIDGTLTRSHSDGAPNRLNAALQLPGLFNNCFFFLNGSFSSPSKADITQWIKHGGGTVLTRSPNPESISPCDKIPYHASPSGLLAKCSHFILYDSRAKVQPSLKYNMAHVKTLSIDWLVECIEKFSLIDPF